MKKIVLGFGLLAILALPAMSQEKEAERVEKAGTVMKEIMESVALLRSEIDFFDRISDTVSGVRLAVSVAGVG